MTVVLYDSFSTNTECAVRGKGAVPSIHTERTTAIFYRPNRNMSVFPRIITNEMSSMPEMLSAAE